MTSLIYFLTFGFLFYWMMKRGGGGKHARGHEEHTVQAVSDRRADQSSCTAQDPVCGMDVDVTRAVGIRSVARGTFYLCSAACLATFDRDPQAYAQRILPAAPLPRQEDSPRDGR